MLKIKSNTNEFTIIFLRRLKRKRMLKRSRSASVQFRTPSTFLHLFFLFQHLFSLFFLLLFSAASFSFSVSVLAPHFCFSPPFLFFSFGSRVPFFSAQKHSFQPKTILSSDQKHFFQPKRFSIFQLFFSPNIFCFSSTTLLFFFFSALFFSGSALFFLF